MEIAQIKQRLSMLEVLSQYHITPDKSNRIHCPFHEDKTPSMQVYEKTGTVYCFSANCKTHGKSLDVIDFIMQKEAITKHEALKKAGELAGGVPPGETQQQASILTAFKSYEQLLSSSSKASEYLDKRGLSWQLLRDKAGVRLGYNAVKSSQMKHCVLFPLRAANNKVTGMYGRSIYDIDGKKHYYLTNRKGLFPYYPPPTTTHLVLTESIIDACTLLQHMDRHTEPVEVLALYGTNGLTDEHLKVITALKGLKQITLFFDGDEPGRKALQSVSVQLKAITKAKTRHVDTPEGEDINSLAISHDPGILNHLIEKATVWAAEPSFFSSERRPSEHRPIEKQKATEETIPQDPTPTNLEIVSAELLIYRQETLKIAVLGGVKLTGLDRLKVTLKITDENNPSRLPIRHNLDLYHAVQIEQLQSKLTGNLDLESHQAARIIEGLTGELESYRNNRIAALQPKKPQNHQLTDTEKREALHYLKSPDLLKRTQQSIAESGLVGEESNALIAWLTYTSRKRESPLQLMCLGASGVGKTYLQERVGALIPQEDKLEVTTLSENAFYYFGREELKHKLILIEDLDGASDVLYPLRELQSKRKISKTVTLKDNKGNLKTVTLTVEGPVSVSGCTTREKLYEDNANRCLLLEIDTSKEQDSRIMDYQKKLSAGLVKKVQETQAQTLLQNVQRLLKPVTVRNPYADRIHLPELVFKPRRTASLLLSFIETVTFYHQYQLETRTDPQTGEPYIQTTPEHLNQALELLKEILFRKSDELTGACRKFLEGLKIHLKAHNTETFTAKEIRKTLRMNPSNLKRYLVELDRYGYIKGQGNRYKGYEYRVVDMGEYQALTSLINSELSKIADRVGGSVAQ